MKKKKQLFLIDFVVTRGENGATRRNPIIISFLLSSDTVHGYSRPGRIPYSYSIKYEYRTRVVFRTPNFVYFSIVLNIFRKFFYTLFRRLWKKKKSLYYYYCNQTRLVTVKVIPITRSLIIFDFSYLFRLDSVSGDTRVGRTFKYIFSSLDEGLNVSLCTIQSGREQTLRHVVNEYRPATEIHKR